jgi:SAM-dependent methyltransferase
VDQRAHSAEPASLGRRIARRLADLGGDHRNPDANLAFAAVVETPPSGAVILSVGGGPSVASPRLINLNLAPYPNVHVVADAYSLPFAAESIAGIHCEAVLEHLEHPETAVREMARVLAPGGQIFAATPFLQVFHGYPSHYQNFTLEGHRRLFERAGLTVLASGTCVGPCFTLVDLVSNFLREYLPGRLASRAAFVLVRALGSPFRLLDRILVRHPHSHVLASTTFVHCARPAVGEAGGHPPSPQYQCSRPSQRDRRSP